MRGQLCCKDKSVWTLPFTELMGDDVLPFLKIPKFSFEVNLFRVSFSFYCHSELASQSAVLS